MTDANGVRPPASAEKSLGEIVTEVSEKTTLLVHEEIELAKAEVTTKLSRLGKGAVIAGAAGIFLVFGLIYGLVAVAHAINSFGFADWVGFAIVWLVLSLLGVVAGLVALRLFKKGSPPVPNMAIEEARATRDTFEEVRR